MQSCVLSVEIRQSPVTTHSWNGFTMKKWFILMVLPLSFLFTQCSPTPADKGQQVLTTDQVNATIKALVAKHGQDCAERIERGVAQAASLWQPGDGTPEDFDAFCQEHFVADSAERLALFHRLSRGLELLYGYSNLLSKELLRPLHLVGDDPTEVDALFGAYSPSAHIADDLYANRLAFITVLNFPYFSLQEKNRLSPRWSRLDWAYARLGEYFTERVPAPLLQDFSRVNTDASTYISEYNIELGHLTDESGARLFPEDLSLLSHWGLRDEIKAQYADSAQGLKRQRLIYRVMERIIDQSIPREVVNSGHYEWNPYDNTIAREGQAKQGTPEAGIRYQHLLNQFHALRAIDAHNPRLPNFIRRQFEGNFEISVEEVEALFTQLLLSPEVRQLANLISQRLERPLEPFDLWYDGFKARSAIAPEKLDALTTKRFPNAEGLQRELPSILTSLGWSGEKARFIAEHVKVEAARGSGHAWGGEMRSDLALLRTRIPRGGMLYKGFNIAIHEFGHNVEQTITLHDVDYYTLHGVPNTAFTEALAFIFQKRDLELLGLREADALRHHLETLDNLWGCYEIMGVSLVDISLWRWLYDHPDATAQELAKAAMEMAKGVWNSYYADIFGVRDQTILAIYSHMIESPLYLSAYPLGHLIDFQLESHLKGKNFATEIERIYSQGRLTPDQWLKEGMGESLSVQPLLNASSEAMRVLEEKSAK